MTAEIELVAKKLPHIEKIFLADGDALVLPKGFLIRLLEKLYASFSSLKRVSSYALPKNLLVKSIEDLKDIRQAGLSLLYYGVESGSDFILKKIQKGANRDQMILGIHKAHEAGFSISTTNLLGVGGEKYSQEHALATASLLNVLQVQYISFLSLMFPMGKERFLTAFGETFTELNSTSLLRELKLILEHLDLKNTVFRSNHASNYLALKGNLPDDKDLLLNQVNRALQSPKAFLRPEFMRGL